MKNRYGGGAGPLPYFYTSIYRRLFKKGVVKGRGRSWERSRPLRWLACRVERRLSFLCGFGLFVLAECDLDRVVQCFAHHGDSGVGGGLSAYSGKDFAGGLAG